MGRGAVNTSIVVLLAFLGGIFTHVLYQRWNPPAGAPVQATVAGREVVHDPNGLTPQRHRVNFAVLSPSPTEVEPAAELPSLMARDVEKIRALTGKQARVRGRVFRVGHSAKSNTYFLNFGPSRGALTAVIFSAAVELFEKNRMAPKAFENREVELTGQIKDHPQYGLEIVLDNPKQIKIIN